MNLPIKPANVSRWPTAAQWEAMKEKIAQERRDAKDSDPAFDDQRRHIRFLLHRFPKWVRPMLDGKDIHELTNGEAKAILAAIEEKAEGWR